MLPLAVIFALARDTTRCDMIDAKSVRRAKTQRTSHAKQKSSPRLPPHKNARTSRRPRRSPGKKHDSRPIYLGRAKWK